MLELLPGTGVALPDGAGTLRFGMSAEEARSVLSGAPRVHHNRQCMTLTRAEYRELRHAHDAWLSRLLHDPAWNTVATYGEVVLTVAGGGPGRTDQLTRVDLDLAPQGPTPSTTPVVWDGVDLFAHPTHDTLSVLPAATRHTPTELSVDSLGLWLHSHPAPATRWSRLTLQATPTGWERCCSATAACAAGGDAFVGILR
ncbi:hypothetical protein [Streptomyces sp. NPDC057702]|uniref:hypothetical protein n=1 Tax=unclassified Streptomyces TaxID=2593676 RepID=UPI0036CB3E60